MKGYRGPGIALVPVFLAPGFVLALDSSRPAINVLTDQGLLSREQT
jgi:chloramphenicol 3-O-phosphotransferase